MIFKMSPLLVLFFVCLLQHWSWRKDKERKRKKEENQQEDTSKILIAIIVNGDFTAQLQFKWNEMQCANVGVLNRDWS